MTTMTFDQKIDNIQDQLDVMRREDSSFRSYTNRKFEEIIGRIDTMANVMATKDDLLLMATKDDLLLMATKDDLLTMATKDDLKDVEERLTKIIVKIAEKVGVSP